MEDSSELAQEEFQSFEEFLQRPDVEMNSKGYETNMASMLTDAMRAESPADKAMLYLELANMAMAAADHALGSQGTITTAVTLTLH